MTAPSIHIHNQFFCGSDSSPCLWLLSQLCQEIVTTAVQKIPELLVLCCINPPADIRVFEVPYKG